MNNSVDQYLLLGISDKRYALKITDAIEIINPKNIDLKDKQEHTVPETLPYHDANVPIIDMAGHLSNTIRENLKNTIIIVSECQGERAALVADSADEIIRVKLGKVIKYSGSGESKDICSACIETDEEKIPILSLSNIYKLSGVIK